MFGVISKIARVIFYAASYATVLVVLTDTLLPEILAAFQVTPVVPLMANILKATVSTLSWIFSKHLIMLGMLIWLAVPIIKVPIYVGRKFL